MQYLTIWDLVLTPIYLLVLGLLAKRHRDKRYPRGHPLHGYYLPGLYAKFAGVIFIALVYQFYYGGGDTFNYFRHSQVINSSLDESFNIWKDLLLGVSPDRNPRLYRYTSQMFWYGDSSTYIVACIGALAGLLNGTTYIPLALLFATISYSGIWAMYRTFTKVYPSLYKPLAIAFLFIPSCAVWGSALFKDTICMFALGWMTYCAFRIFVDKDFSIKNIFLLSLSFYLLAIIKIYILMAFVPALGLWLLMTYSGRIRSQTVRWMINIVFLAIVGSGFLFFARRFAAELNEYSLENIAKKAKKTQDWITYVSENQEGSAYDIGKLDGTLGSMITKFPQAVNVTLYRPYLWETAKPIMLLSALESACFLVLTLLIFYRRGITTTFKTIFNDPNLSFFFIFTFIFAFAVGISTGNFGSLSRYKIPCMPFFAALLLILYSQTLARTAVKKHLPHAKMPVRRLA